jgi:hypothetical protein
MSTISTLFLTHWIFSLDLALVTIYNLMILPIPLSDFLKLLCWVWVHCNIYKGSCSLSNISYLNSPFSLPHAPHWFLEQFEQVSFLHLHTCVHSVCIIFTLLLLSRSAPHHRSCSVLLFCDFVEEKNIKVKWETRNFASLT